MNHACRTTVAAWCALLLLAAASRADVKLPRVLSDHAVLQRDRAVPVWGTAAAEEQVTVEFAGQKKQATADADGKWSVKLDAMPASAEGRDLTVRGNNVITVRDVLVGEVWLGSGQSNLAFTIRSNKNLDQIRSAAKLPTLRFYTAGERPTDTDKTPPRSDWQVCSPQTVEKCSAVLYFFGKELQEKLDGVPIGLINASVGGTSITLWIDRDVQMSQPDLREPIDKDEAAHAKFDLEAEMQKYHASKRYLDWQAQAEKDKAEGKKPSPPPLSPKDLYERWQPGGTWFRVRVAPLIPYGIRGVVWYQGEADGSIPAAKRYQKQLPLLIEDWRTRWGEADFPFLIVQLPYWKPAAEGWSPLREAQLRTLSVPNTGMITTFDIGDPDNVHPADKTQFGHRLAQLALGMVYHKDVVPTGPMPLRIEIRGATIWIKFSLADGGLKTKDGKDIVGFQLAGEDHVWHDATAKIDNDAITLSSPDVPRPVAVRYAWDGNPANPFYNAADLPATPFRDESPLIRS